MASCSYWQYIKSGTGFLIIKATAVSLKRQTSPHCVELWPEEAKQAKNKLDLYNVNHQCQSPFNWPMPVEKFQLIFHEKPIIKDMHPILPSDPYGWKTTVPSAIFYDFSCANGNDYQGHSKN